MYKNLLEYIVKNLVTYPEKIEISEAEAIERLIADNYLGQENYEAALSAAVLGDAFYRVRYGQELGGEMPPELAPPKNLPVATF